MFPRSHSKWQSTLSNPGHLALEYEHLIIIFYVHWLLRLQPENAVILEIAACKLHEGLCFFTAVSSSPEYSRCLINAIYVAWMNGWIVDSQLCSRQKLLLTKKQKWTKSEGMNIYLVTFSVYLPYIPLQNNYH